MLIIASGKLYLYKTLAYNFVGIDDLDLFDYRVIDTDKPQPWNVSREYNLKPMPWELKTHLESLESIAFVVIKNDSILYEQYWDHYSDSSYTNSFSVAKSIIGVLTGIALKEGKIKNLDQKVSEFIPEFKEGRRSELTIRHLLTMSAGLTWDEAYANPLSVTTEAYYGTDLNKLLLEQQVISDPGKEFVYQSGCTQLLAMVLQKATGTSLSNYASQKLWKPLGAEKDAYWSVDHTDGIEKAYCCFYSNARDFARIGSLYLHSGNYKGNQIVDSAYVQESITPADILDNGKPNRIYGFHWWITEHEGKKIFYCRGILGQYIVVIPDENIVFVRLGHKRAQKTESGELTDLPVYIKYVLEWVK